MNFRPVFLFTFANDIQQSLQLDAEWRTTEQALEVANDQDRINYVLVPSTEEDDLWGKFNRFHGQITVFHFGGHSNEEGLDLVDGMLEGHKLTALLQQEQNLQLVFLNGCSNQAHVQTLLDAGVPAVITTSTSIQDRRATRLAQKFYEALSSGRTLAEAFELAATFVNDREETPLVEYRQVGFQGGEEEAFPWGLYQRTNADLSWRIPSVKVGEEPSPTSGQQVQNFGEVGKQVNINHNTGDIHL